MLLISLILKYKISVLYAVFVLVLSLLPFQNSMGSSFFSIPYADKVAHFILYGILAFLFILESRKDPKLIDYLKIIIVCLIFGGMIELLQMLEPYRSGEWLDLIANLSGSISAIPASIIIKKIIL